MKAVLLSVQPQWCELIASGKKSVEVRKTKPRIDVPFKCYIYCTQDKNGWFDFLHKTRLDGKIIGEFVCDNICTFECNAGGFLVKGDIATTQNAQAMSCLSDYEFRRYAKEKSVYGWHISDLVIYDIPKELNEFKKINRDCWYADLGLAKRDCPECQNKGCFIQRPPQSWCYVESLTQKEE